jgi:plasmid stabilization system protein ParE
MPILKNLTFTAVPARTHDPVAARRSKLVERLEEQKALLADPAHVRKSTRWTGKGDERRQVEREQRVRPWWRTDPSGAVVMAVYHGARPLEFEKGKAGIAVADRGKLPALIDTLIAAAKAGELDALMAKAPKPGGAKARRAA